MKNPAFYHALRNFVRASCALLGNNLTALPITIKETLPAESARSASNEEIDWSLLVSKNIEGIQHLKEYADLNAVLQNETTLAKQINRLLIGPGHSRTRFDVDNFVYSLLSKLLREQNGVDFKEMVFAALYNKIEDYFYRETLGYRYFSPLEGFEMEKEQIELGDRFFIIKISEDDKEQLHSQLRASMLSPYPFPAWCEYALELSLETPKRFASDGGEDEDSLLRQRSGMDIAEDKFNEACAALRLFHQGTVGYSYIQATPTSWRPIGGMTRISHANLLKASAGERYRLLNRELPDFLAFWEMYQKMRQNTQKRLNLALRRFHFGYERIRADDKLLDYSIAFEALLSPSGKNELRYRISLLGATLLGHDPDSRETIFHELQTMYDQRSKLVHGGKLADPVKLDGEEIAFSSFVERIENHLRLTLRALLKCSEGRSEAQVLQSLGDKIIRGE